MLINREIDSSEILVRFIFEDHFIKKNVTPNRIDKREVFMDNRLVGVSMQRHKYVTSDNECKERGKSIRNKKFVGFVVFLKDDFLKACNEFVKIREQFEAEIRFTPLDENLEIRKDIDSIYITDPGNPSHCDMNYINPAIENDEPNPKTALRAFSQQLYAKSCLILDPNPDSEELELDGGITLQFENCRS